jgi:hypothetical protein
MRGSTICLLLVGCVWALFVVLTFLDFAGIANFDWSVSGVLYWLAMLIGPLSLIVGSTLILRGRTKRFSAALVAIGCLALTGFALYNSLAAIKLQPLQAPPPYLFYILLLFIMGLTDIAGFKVIRQLLGLRAVAP